MTPLRPSRAPLDRSVASLLLVALLGALDTGCAQIGVTQQRTVRTVERRTSKPIVTGHSGKATIRATVVDDTLSIVALDRPVCTTYAEERREAVTANTRTQTGFTTGLAMLTTIIAGGFAGYAFAKAPDAPTDKPAGCDSSGSGGSGGSGGSAGSSNSDKCPLTKGDLNVIGGVLASVAGTTFLIGAVDAVRSSDSVEVTSLGWERTGDPEKTPCGESAPLADTSVEVDIGGVATKATTGRNGTASYDVGIRTATPDGASRDTSAFAVKFWQASKVVVRVAGDDASTTSSFTIEPRAIAGYGEQVGAKRAGLAAAEAAVAERARRALAAEELRRDEADWAGSGWAVCAAPTEANDCFGVAGYIRRFPSGAHATQAREVLGRSAPRIAALHAEEAQKQEAEDRKRKAEEAAEERKRKAEEAAEERAQAAEAFREKLAAQETFRKCREACKPVCRALARRIPAKVCLQACVEERCQ